MRSLGYGEQLWYRLSQGASNSVVMVFDLQGEVDPERFRSALERVQARHPLLQAFVDDSVSPPRYMKASTPELPLTIADRKIKDQWKELARAWLSRSVGINGELLWSVTLLLGEGSSEAVFHLNHTIMDGHSLQVIASDLMRAYDEPDKPLAPIPEVGSCESLLPQKGVLGGLWGAFATVRNMFKRPAGRLLDIGGTPGTDGAVPTGTGYRIVELDKDVASGFMKQVKASGQGPHATVAAMMMLEARAMNCPEADSIVSKFSAAVNIRPKLAMDVNEQVGYFVTGFQSIFSLKKEDDLESLAARVNEDIHTRYNLDFIAGSILFKRLILAVKRDAQSLVTAARKSARFPLHLTNLGRLNIQAEGGGLYLRRFMAIPSIEVSGRAMILLQLQSFEGRLQLLFTWVEPQTDPVFAERFVEGVAARVREYAGVTESTPSPEAASV